MGILGEYHTAAYVITSYSIHYTKLYECRAASEKDPFRLAILDMEMPEMDGITLGRNIRENPLLCVITSYSIHYTKLYEKMDSFNFYYLADAQHNPERKPVWTGAYLDPAGHGWMTSCVVPVYRGDFLEGVTGLDRNNFV